MRNIKALWEVIEMKDSLIVMTLWVVVLVMPFALQVIICKKSQGKIGLVLPVIAFIVSVIYTLNVAKIGENVNLVAVATFILTNIFTLVLYIIYHVYRKRNIKNKEVEKVKLRDL